jgi:hypothetical protein
MVLAPGAPYSDGTSCESDLFVSSSAGDRSRLFRDFPPVPLSRSEARTHTYLHARGRKFGICPSFKGQFLSPACQALTVRFRHRCAPMESL